MKRLFFFLALLGTVAQTARAEDGEPLFRNVAGAAGIAGVPTIRCRFADLDGDGWPDVILGTDRVYLNRAGRAPGARTFADATAPSGFETLFRNGDRTLPAQFVLAGDVDNDGDVDLFVARNCEPEKPAKGPAEGMPAAEDGHMLLEWKDPGVRSQILLNDGSGCFTPLADSGVEEPPETTCAACFVDADGDGRLDLFTGNFYVAYGWSYECYPDRLFRGLGDGRFVESTSRAGLLTVRRHGYRNSSRPTYGVAHCDWNNDGRQDLLVCAYGRQWNCLWRNEGGGRFTDVAADTGFDGDEDRSGAYPDRIRRPPEAPFRSNGNTFSVASADFDNDGDLDLFVGEITHWWAGDSSDLSDLLVNQGPEKGFAFRREGRARGIRREHAEGGWNQGDLHVGWLDVDNDGLQDLIIASSDYPDDQILRLYRQTPEHGFTDATTAAGFAWRNPTGISFGDYDRDGRVDILTGNNNMRLTPEQRAGRVLEAALFRNTSAPGNHFLCVRLEGKGAGASNRLGIGARVEVTAGGVTQLREIAGGGGHCGQQDVPAAHFGLGASARVERLRVRWPDRACTVQEFTGLEADAFVVVREGADAVEVERRVPRPLAAEEALEEEGPKDGEDGGDGEEGFLRR